MCINALGNDSSLVFIPRAVFLILEFVLVVQFYVNSRCRILISGYRDSVMPSCNGKIREQFH